MMYEIVLFGSSFLLAGLGGFLGALLFSARFGRRCTQIEWAIGDLQQRASSFKGREMADKRWKKAAAFDSEMEEVFKSAPASPRRYDNDPLGG